MEGKFRVSEGDWYCSDSDCGNLNFARRTACNRCNKERESSHRKKKLGSEIGKAAAEKSKGLFSAEDWECTKCGNVNWARRQQCNMCNAPKFTEVEERTGYGGGYNDRGVVEYVRRDESDDEFDEFGRRKKRKSRSVGDQYSPRSNNGRRNGEYYDEHRSKNTYAEEEDEEEEEEGDSLAKYDLSEWDADAPAAENPDKRNDAGERARASYDSFNGSRKSNRSRSRSPL